MPSRGFCLKIDGKSLAPLRSAGAMAPSGCLHLHELVGVEGVDAAGPPRGLLGEKRLEPRAPLDEPFAHPRDDVVPPDLPLDRDRAVRPPACIAGISVSGLQPLVGAGVEHEPDEAVEVEVVRRHARDDVTRSPPSDVAVGAGVADRTVEPDQIDALVVALRDADRQILLPALVVGSIEEAEGAIVEAAVERLGEEPGQRLPHPIGNAAAFVGADRAVLEMLDDIGDRPRCCCAGGACRRSGRSPSRRCRSDSNSASTITTGRSRRRRRRELPFRRR